MSQFGQTLRNKRANLERELRKNPYNKGAKERLKTLNAQKV